MLPGALVGDNSVKSTTHNAAMLVRVPWLHMYNVHDVAAIFAPTRIFIPHLDFVVHGDGLEWKEKIGRFVFNLTRRKLGVSKADHKPSEGLLKNLSAVSVRQSSE